MTRRALGLGLGGLVLGLGLASWLIYGGPFEASDNRPVTEAEARGHLNRLVAAGQARDFDKLCGLAGAVGNCRWLLQEAGPDAVPAAAPRVESATYHDSESEDTTPGWVLVVTGTDGRGKPYRTEVLIFRDDESRVVATNAVYWSNFKISLGDPNGPTSPDDTD